MKWASIPLILNDLKYQLKKNNYTEMIDILFKRPLSASHKYDGTNVGKDETGLLYGRNLTISSKVKSYQKTPLDALNKIDVALVK